MSTDYSSRRFETRCVHVGVDKDDTFNVELQMKGRDRLQVMGYMGVKFLSETHMWKRAPEPFAICSAPRAS